MLEEFKLPGQVGLAPRQPKQERAMPPGEGWVRHSEDMLVNERAGIYFVQEGERVGKYLRRGKEASGWEEVPVPHSPEEFSISVKPATASVVRSGAKLDRAILLSELARTSRLALKFPLSFLDTPACAFAAFQGVRGAAAAQWCAENFHKRLLPRLAERIHRWETKDLEDLLCDLLKELDAELLKGPNCFSGCSALLALLIGNNLIVAGVGQVRAVLLLDKVQELLSCLGSTRESTERERVEKSRGLLRDGLLYSAAAACDGDLDEAQRILRAPHVFAVLQIDASRPADAKEVRSAYRRLALRVHPDKAGEGADKDALKSAFERLDAAKDALEVMLGESAEACNELHRILRSEVHTRKGAAAFLNVFGAATTDTVQVVQDAEREVKAILSRISKMQLVALDYDLANSMCREAVETLRRGSDSAEALQRQEALLRMGVTSTHAIGVRDLRCGVGDMPIVLMEPSTASYTVPAGKRCHLGLLCGAAATVTDNQLCAARNLLPRHPKAMALRWCLDADPAAASANAACVLLQSAVSSETATPPAKKLKAIDTAFAGQVRIRHILFSHKQLKNPDPNVRREVSATQAETEVLALETLEKLQKGNAQAFLPLCRKHSDCQTADNPGVLSGDLGWLARGQMEPALEEAVFGLELNEFSDIVVSSRGFHVMQRLA